MSLRITGGVFRSRLIKTPRGKKTRPTTSIIRESLFNICQHQLVNSTFLDLFAGSGIIGIEALSRGADFVSFVEKDRFAVQCIYDNLETLGLNLQAQVLAYDYKKALPLLRKRPYSIIYIDPPYCYYDDITFLTSLIEEMHLQKIFLKDSSIFIEQAYNVHKEPMVFDRLKLIGSKKYGSSCLNHYIA